MGLAHLHVMLKPKFARSIRGRARRGFSLLEIIVAIAIIAMVSAAVAVAIVKQKVKADISLTTTNAQSIRNGVKMWWVDHDSGSCPTVAVLVSDGALDRSKSIKADAWQEPWRIQCSDGDVSVVSKGPDKKPDTEDDIVVPNG
jgi:prepilin-type N-terminal cleavage/methylation domain-containing protein